MTSFPSNVSYYFLFLESFYEDTMLPFLSSSFNILCAEYTLTLHRLPGVLLCTGLRACTVVMLHGFGMGGGGGRGGERKDGVV